jgi:hypothetical protein
MLQQFRTAHDIMVVSGSGADKRPNQGLGGTAPARKNAPIGGHHLCEILRSVQKEPRRHKGAKADAKEMQKSFVLKFKTNSPLRVFLRPFASSRLLCFYRTADSA